MLEVAARWCRALHLRHVWMAVRYSSTMPVRVLLTIAALLWALFLAVAPLAIYAEPPYDLLFHLAPRGVWAAVFAVDGLLLAWRIVDPRTRVGVSRVVNAATCGLWSMYLFAVGLSQGYLSPDAADEIALLLGSAWLTLRTDLTVGDRETA